MRSTGDWNRFFPNHFAAQPYQESLASFYWPLSRADCDRLGFRQSPPEPARTMEALDAAQVPDHSNEADKNLTKHVFWDSVASRPFQIAQPDIDFAKELGAPLPNSFYMRRLQDNFRLIPFNGTLRETTCGLCKKMTKTGWPQEYDGRILCEECYLKEVY